MLYIFGLCFIYLVRASHIYLVCAIYIWCALNYDWSVQHFGFCATFRFWRMFSVNSELEHYNADLQRLSNVTDVVELFGEKHD